VFPIPFLRDSEAFRLATFFDIGNVYDRVGDFELGDLRYSAGVSARWLSAFGPLAISLAYPINEKDDDETETFQFSFGVPF
jgi:outer membrane protein insertion porin family